MTLQNDRQNLSTTEPTNERQGPYNEYIGPKMKLCFILIWAHLLFLTWLVLATSKVSIKLQAICLLFTIVSVYLQLVLMQDYFYLKTHHSNTQFRRDVRLIKPLLQKEKKNDK